MRKGFFVNYNRGTGGVGSMERMGGEGGAGGEWRMGNTSGTGRMSGVSGTGRMDGGANSAGGMNSPPTDHRVIVRNAGALAAIGELLRGMFTVLLYAAVTALSSVGLTALLNRPTRDMLIDLARATLFGG